MLFKNFAGKFLCCWSLILIKLQAFRTPAQVFSCEICKTFKNIYFKEHLLTTASGYGNFQCYEVWWIFTSCWLSHDLFTHRGVVFCELVHDTTYNYALLMYLGLLVTVTSYNNLQTMIWQKINVKKNALGKLLDCDNLNLLSKVFTALNHQLDRHRKSSNVPWLPLSQDSFSCKKCLNHLKFNPFVPNAPFLYHLKTSETFPFFYVSRWYRKGELGRNGLI